MHTNYKVDFISIIDDNSNRKWYQMKNRPLPGKIIAERLQSLIDDRVHQGYQLVQMIDAQTNTEGHSTNEMGHHYPRPDGFVIIFGRP